MNDMILLLAVLLRFGLNKTEFFTQTKFNAKIKNELIL